MTGYKPRDLVGAATVQVDEKCRAMPIGSLLA